MHKPKPRFVDAHEFFAFWGIVIFGGAVVLSVVSLFIEIICLVIFYVIPFLFGLSLILTILAFIFYVLMKLFGSESDN